MDRFKDFGLVFPSHNTMQCPIQRRVRTNGRSIIFEDDRGQQIEFDRLEFGKIMHYALSGGFIQIVGADIDARNVDIFEYREDRRKY